MLNLNLRGLNLISRKLSNSSLVPEIPKIFGQRKQALNESRSSNNKHVSHVIDSDILLSITKISTLTEQNFRLYN